MYNHDAPGMQAVTAHSERPFDVNVHVRSFAHASRRWQWGASKLAWVVHSVIDRLEKNLHAPWHHAGALPRPCRSCFWPLSAAAGCLMLLPTAAQEPIDKSIRILEAGLACERSSRAESTHRVQRAREANADGAEAAERAQHPCKFGR